ncbi:hypothetical protein DFH06DRAFT_1125909 [Mycena polygramma]|nr:hypothetical protein DFH06DRAFT_1125909 [Mycena polygramma]
MAIFRLLWLCAIVTAFPISFRLLILRIPNSVARVATPPDSLNPIEPPPLSRNMSQRGKNFVRGVKPGSNSKGYRSVKDRAPTPMPGPRTKPVRERGTLLNPPEDNESEYELSADEEENVAGPSHPSAKSLGKRRAQSEVPNPAPPTLPSPPRLPAAPRPPGPRTFDFPAPPMPFTPSMVALPPLPEPLPERIRETLPMRRQLLGYAMIPDDSAPPLEDSVAYLEQHVLELRGELAPDWRPPHTDVPDLPPQPVLQVPNTAAIEAARPMPPPHCGPRVRAPNPYGRGRSGSGRCLRRAHGEAGGAQARTQRDTRAASNRFCPGEGEVRGAVRAGSRRLHGGGQECKRVRMSNQYARDEPSRVARALGDVEKRLHEATVKLSVASAALKEVASCRSMLVSILDEAYHLNRQRLASGDRHSLGVDLDLIFEILHSRQAPPGFSFRAIEGLEAGPVLTAPAPLPPSPFRFDLGGSTPPVSRAPPTPVNAEAGPSRKRKSADTDDETTSRSSKRLRGASFDGELIDFDELPDAASDSSVRDEGEVGREPSAVPDSSPPPSAPPFVFPASAGTHPIDVDDPQFSPVMHQGEFDRISQSSGFPLSENPGARLDIHPNGCDQCESHGAPCVRWDPLSIDSKKSACLRCIAKKTKCNPRVGKFRYTVRTAAFLIRWNTDPRRTANAPSAVGPSSVVSQNPDVPSIASLAANDDDDSSLSALTDEVDELDERQESPVPTPPRSPTPVRQVSPPPPPSLPPTPTASSSGFRVPVDRPRTPVAPLYLGSTRASRLDLPEFGYTVPQFSPEPRYDFRRLVMEDGQRVIPPTSALWRLRMPLLEREDVTPEVAVARFRNRTFYILWEAIMKQRGAVQLAGAEAQAAYNDAMVTHWTALPTELPGIPPGELSPVFPFFVPGVPIDLWWNAMAQATNRQLSQAFPYGLFRWWGNLDLDHGRRAPYGMMFERPQTPGLAGASSTPRHTTPYDNADLMRSLRLHAPRTDDSRAMSRGPSPGNLSAEQLQISSTVDGDVQAQFPGEGSTSMADLLSGAHLSPQWGPSSSSPSRIATPCYRPAGSDDDSAGPGRGNDAGGVE